jgi:hypothetical protein
MKPLIRFGRRIALTPTVQIRRELRVLCAEEDVRELCAEAEGLPCNASWDLICASRTCAVDGV